MSRMKPVTASAILYKGSSAKNGFFPTTIIEPAAQIAKVRPLELLHIDLVHTHVAPFHWIGAAPVCLAYELYYVRAANFLTVDIVF